MSLARAGPQLASVSRVLVQERGNAWRAALGKVARTEYLHRFEVRLVRPDGSSIMVPAAEPRKVFQAAVDLKQLSEEARRERLAARKPKTKQIKQEVIDDNFDADEYINMWSAPETTKKTSKK